MATHHLVFRTVDRKNFDNILDGTKPVETRAATVRYANIKVGDMLRISCGDDTVEKAVKRVKHFNSVEELLEQVPMASINPDAKVAEDIYKMYYSYPGYKDKIAKHGLMAFWL